MGCGCSKGTRLNEHLELENHERDKIVKSSKASKWLGPSSRMEEAVVEDFQSGNDVTVRLISNQPAEENVGFIPILLDEGEKKAMFTAKSTEQELQRRPTMDARERGGQIQLNSPKLVGMPSGEKGAQVAAGWPSWLTAVAGEAINGWVPRKADSFEKLDKIGQGTYSSVYRARDLETNKLVALKKVRFATMDPESVRFMAREIIILRRLDHPNVMKLEGLITSRGSGSLYLVFEYMDHDLAGLASTPGVKLSEAQIKCYMQQLLRGLAYCHSHGVLHRDIKGANLLMDNNGNLKIGDFGLATFFGSRQRQPLTSRVVTLWYRPPELLLGATDYGIAVDLWSAGCILAELFAGKPIMPGRTEVEQLHKIFKLCGSPSEEYWKKSKLPHATIFKPQHPYKRCFADTYKDFPSSSLTLLDTLLAVEPDCRGSASSALQSEFFTTNPLPCDPSSLPKYPPSKEFDTKLREEEARRRKAAGGKGCEHESTNGVSRESKAVPAPDANAELQASIQKRKGQPNSKSISEKHNPENGCSGFPTESFKGTAIPSMTFGSSSRNGAELRTQRSYMDRGAAQLSKFSNSVALRGSSRFDSARETSMNPHWPEERHNGTYNHLDDGESSAKHDWTHHLLNGQKSSHKDEQLSGKGSTMGYVKKNRIHYSGPLMPPGGNLEEMLKEHEKQVQNAVRKARMDKVKIKKTHGENGLPILTESLLHHGENGR